MIASYHWPTRYLSVRLSTKRRSLVDDQVRIPANVNLATFQRICELLERYQPILKNESEVISVLVKVALAGMDNGAIPTDMDELHEFVNRPHQARSQTIKSK
jgi:hypothetical protein